MATRQCTITSCRSLARPNSLKGGGITDNDYPRTFREVGIKLNQISEDVAEIKSGQRKVVGWIASLISSLVAGGVLGFLFQK